MEKIQLEIEARDQRQRQRAEVRELKKFERLVKRRKMMKAGTVMQTVV